MNQKVVKRMRKMLKAEYPQEVESDREYAKSIHKLCKENKVLIRRHLKGLVVKQAKQRRPHSGFPIGLTPLIVWKRIRNRFRPSKKHTHVICKP